MTYFFLLKCICVVVGDPLITIPGDPLHTSRMVPSRCQAILRDYTLDLLVIENARRARARPRVRASRKFANAVWSSARWV